MSVGRLSFWQQNALFWNRSQLREQALSQSRALITAMGNVASNQARGLASIATQKALDRTKAAIQSALQDAQKSSQNAAAASGAAGAAKAAPTKSAPAIGTGTVPLSASTSLLALGIIPNGTITVSDNTFTTTYASNGKDTVGDLINAINAQKPGNANAAAWLDGKGHLVVSGRTDFDKISVGGGYAGQVGFGAKNSSFQPATPPKATVAPSASGGANSGASAAANSSTASGTNNAAGVSQSAPRNSAPALQSLGTAEFFLAANGQLGTTVNTLA
jgi:hypothetical protein